MAEFFINSKMAGWLTVLIAAMFPIVELRGAIPIGEALGMEPLFATVLSIIGSTIPVPFIFFAARPVIKALKKSRFFKAKVERFLEKTLKKSEQIQKYEFWGIVLFVGVPLPGTGAWTGTLIATLLDMRFKRVLLAMLLGNILAGSIVFTITQLAVKSFRLFF